ncbi:MAG: bifunctional glycosyltransferase family 2 protein/CDP-glycerol:glycerophosphate glycerophosphotransferase [Lachnospiraceae bacterium]|nr:bifunctional glycosyltransferase family 2 protein/CDP-glycerol:glycerophosphate glycerophosphotransferase [Lachnospiraceae bacterium]
MRVSVIIPFNKGDTFLRDCLNSLCEQEYKDYEILLISDHYAENINELVLPYMDKLPIRLFEVPDGKTGVAAARNIGLDNAQGEFVYFLDSDDYIFQDAIRTLVETADDTDEDMVYGKKHFTYYRRDVFLPIYIEKREALIAQKYIENGGAPGDFIENTTDSASDSLSDNDEDSDEDDDEDSDNTDVSETGDAADEAEDDVAGNDETVNAVIRSLIENSTDREYRNTPAYKEYMYNRFPEMQELATEDEKDTWLRDHYTRAHRKAIKRLIYKKKRFRNISILHILIRKSIIEEKHLRFDESLKYYSDMPFLATLLNDEGLHIRKRFGSHYIKRKHQDIVNHPALTQIQDEGRFDEMINAFNKLLEIAGTEGYVRTAVEHQIAFYCSGYFLKKVKRSDAKKWRRERFKKVSELTNEIKNETLKKEDRWRRKAVLAVRDGDVEKSVKVITKRLAWKKLIKYFKGKNVLNRHMYVRYLKNKPVSEDVIMFEAFFGKGYSDSPKYIYEHIAKNYPGKYKYVWVMDKKYDLPYGGEIVERFGRKYMYYLATAKYFVFNVRQPQWFKHRDGQTFFETWHGTPLKRLAFDIEDVFGASPNYKKQIYKQSRGWDYLLSPNRFSTDCFESCFQYDRGKIVEYGYPRNDILHLEEGKEVAKKVKEKLGIAPDKKLVLYAPTWRDDECYGHGQYKFDLKLDLDLMQKELGDGYVVLLRTHYFIADAVDTTKYGIFVVNVCRYDDIAELYLISDILITDYSSVFFDYAGLKRPMLFYTYDLEKYRDILHGFYMNMEDEVPGPMLFTTAEIVDAIKNIDEVQKKYAAKYDAFYEKYCSLEDGHAAERCVKKLLTSK